MCWALLLAQTEQRKHGNLCPEAEKLTTDTKLLIERRGRGGGENVVYAYLHRPRPSEVQRKHTRPLAPKPGAVSHTHGFPIISCHFSPGNSHQTSTESLEPARSLCSSALHQETWTDPVSSGEFAESRVSSQTCPPPPIPLSRSKHSLDALWQNFHFHPRCCGLQKSGDPGYRLLTADEASA